LPICWSIGGIEEHGQDHRRRAVDGHRHRGRRVAQVEARVQHLEVVQRGDRDAGIADLAVDVGARIGVAAVERDRVECGGQALGRHAFGNLEEALVGAEGVAFAGEHAGRIFVLALEGEHAGGVGEGTGHVLAHQELEQFALVLEARQRDLADLRAGQRLVDQAGADFLVADLDHVLVAGIGLLHVRPHRQQLPGIGRELAVLPGDQVIEVVRILLASLEDGLGRLQRLALAGQGRLFGDRACGSRAACRRSPPGSAPDLPERWRARPTKP
jgi:hypothetical protein